MQRRGEPAADAGPGGERLPHRGSRSAPRPLTAGPAGRIWRASGGRRGAGAWRRPSSRWIADRRARRRVSRARAELVAAREPAAVPAALAALDRALAAGAWVAGFASYELGYAFEPRLAPLLPAERRLPLLAFGVFGPPGPAEPAAPGGSLGPFRPAWDAARLRARPSTRVAELHPCRRHLPGEPHHAAPRALGGRRRRRWRRGWRRGSRSGTGRWWRCRGRRSSRARRSSSSRSTGGAGSRRGR